MAAAQSEVRIPQRDGSLLKPCSKAMKERNYLLQKPSFSIREKQQFLNALAQLSISFLF